MASDTVVPATSAENGLNSVKLPANMDSSQWFAINTDRIRNDAFKLCDKVSKYCTDKTCPQMCATNKFVWLWSDGIEFKYPVKCTAPEHIKYLREWCDKEIKNYSQIKEKTSKYPPSFPHVAQSIIKRTLRVYAHLYHHHFQTLRQLNLVDVFDDQFGYLYFFAQEAGIIGRIRYGSEFKSVIKIIPRIKKQQDKYIKDTTTTVQ